MINEQQIERIARDFAILDQLAPSEAPLIYLDNAATTQKPAVVINAISNYYRHYNANVHRGAHFLSEKATVAFEQARNTIAQWLGAAASEEIIWTKGTTEAINLVANSWGRCALAPGDLIVLSEMEHHANIVPWQLVAEATGARIAAIKLTADFTLDQAHYRQLLEQKPKLVALAHVSNTLGTINPIKQMVAQAKAAGAVTLVDGAQAVSHLSVDVQQLDCDFYAFSGHKVFGPTGIGVLYGKKALLDAMPPWQGGGEMITQVSFAGTSFNRLPFKFEAGTPNIAGAIGLAAAVRYLQSLDTNALELNQKTQFNAIFDWLQQESRITLFSRREDNVGIVSFALNGEHHQDIGTLLDQQGVAVRTGHHCTMPLMNVLGVKGTVRASLSIYNRAEDVAGFIRAMEKVLSILD